MGAALQVANTAPPELQLKLVETARRAFTDGYSLAMPGGAGMVVAASIVVLRWFPRN